MFFGPDQTVSGSDPLEFSFGFWNLENLFDTIDDPNNPGDDEFLPDREWDEARYQRKLEHLGRAIEALDSDILAVCEVENRRVLEDLISLPALEKSGYQIAHLDTPDSRGIDLALLARGPCQISGQTILHDIDLGEGNRPTRGILEVPLEIQGIQLTVLVNHWPSRYGGKEKTDPLRRIAAQVAREIVNEKMSAVASTGTEAEILLLGDFNDDPFSTSVKDVLLAVREKRAVTHPSNLMSSNPNKVSPRLLNPSWSFLSVPDHGTYYYWNDWTWNVFDQAILSPGLLDNQGLTYVDGSLEVHAPEFLRDTQKNAYRPKRFRKFRGQWVEGFSDHFAIRGRMTCKADRPAVDAPDSQGD